jgi:hypothetical protein
MRSYFVPAIAVAMIMPEILSARSDDIPTLDVRPVCRGIASQSGLEVGLQQTNFEGCMNSEQATREQLKQEWSTFTTADKAIALPWLRQEENRVTLSSSPVWKWRAMCGP